MPGQFTVSNATPPSYPVASSGFTMVNTSLLSLLTDYFFPQEISVSPAVQADTDTTLTLFYEQSLPLITQSGKTFNLVVKRQRGAEKSSFIAVDNDGNEYVVKPLIGPLGVEYGETITTHEQAALQVARASRVLRLFDLSPFEVEACSFKLNGETFHALLNPYVPGFVPARSLYDKDTATIVSPKDRQTISEGYGTNYLLMCLTLWDGGHHNFGVSGGKFTIIDPEAVDFPTPDRVENGAHAPFGFFDFPNKVSVDKDAPNPFQITIGQLKLSIAKLKSILEDPNFLQRLKETLHDHDTYPDDPDFVYNQFVRNTRFLFDFFKSNTPELNQLTNQLPFHRTLLYARLASHINSNYPSVQLPLVNILGMAKPFKGKLESLTPTQEPDAAHFLNHQEELLILSGTKADLSKTRIIGFKVRQSLQVIFYASSGEGMASLHLGQMTYDIDTIVDELSKFITQFPDYSVDILGGVKDNPTTENNLTKLYNIFNRLYQQNGIVPQNITKHPYYVLGEEYYYCGIKGDGTLVKVSTSDISTAWREGRLGAGNSLIRALPTGLYYDNPFATISTINVSDPGEWIQLSVTGRLTQEQVTRAAQMDAKAIAARQAKRNRYAEQLPQGTYLRKLSGITSEAEKIKSILEETAIWSNRAVFDLEGVQVEIDTAALFLRKDKLLFANLTTADMKKHVFHRVDLNALDPDVRARFIQFLEKLTPTNESVILRMPENAVYITTELVRQHADHIQYPSGQIFPDASKFYETNARLDEEAGVKLPNESDKPYTPHQAKETEQHQQPPAIIETSLKDRPDEQFIFVNQDEAVFLKGPKEKMDHTYLMGYALETCRQVWLTASTPDKHGNIAMIGIHLGSAELDTTILAPLLTSFFELHKDYNVTVYGGIKDSAASHLTQSHIDAFIASLTSQGYPKPTQYHSLPLRSRETTYPFLGANHSQTMLSVPQGDIQEKVQYERVGSYLQTLRASIPGNPNSIRTTTIDLSKPQCVTLSNHVSAKFAQTLTTQPAKDIVDQLYADNPRLPQDDRDSYLDEIERIQTDMKQTAMFASSAVINLPGSGHVEIDLSRHCTLDKALIQRMDSVDFSIPKDVYHQIDLSLYTARQQAQLIGYLQERNVIGLAKDKAVIIDRNTQTLLINTRVVHAYAIEIRYDNKELFYDAPSAPDDLSQPNTTPLNEEVTAKEPSRHPDALTLEAFDTSNQSSMHYVSHLTNDFSKGPIAYNIISFTEAEAIKHAFSTQTHNGDITVIVGPKTLKHTGQNLMVAIRFSGKALDKFSSLNPSILNNADILTRLRTHHGEDLEVSIIGPGTQTSHIPMIKNMLTEAGYPNIKEIRNTHSEKESILFKTDKSLRLANSKLFTATQGRINKSISVKPGSVITVQGSLKTLSKQYMLYESAEANLCVWVIPSEPSSSQAKHSMVALHLDATSPDMSAFKKHVKALHNMYKDSGGIKAFQWGGFCDNEETSQIQKALDNCLKELAQEDDLQLQIDAFAYRDPELKGDCASRVVNIKGRQYDVPTKQSAMRRTKKHEPFAMQYTVPPIAQFLNPSLTEITIDTDQSPIVSERKKQGSLSLIGISSNMRLTQQQAELFTPQNAGKLIFNSIRAQYPLTSLSARICTEEMEALLRQGASQRSFDLFVTKLITNYFASYHSKGEATQNLHYFLLETFHSVYTTIQQIDSTAVYAHKATFTLESEEIASDDKKITLVEEEITLDIGQIYIGQGGIHKSRPHNPLTDVFHRIDYPKDPTLRARYDRLFRKDPHTESPLHKIKKRHPLYPYLGHIIRNPKKGYDLIPSDAIRKMASKLHYPSLTDLEFENKGNYLQEIDAQRIGLEIRSDIFKTAEEILALEEGVQESLRHKTSTDLAKSLKDAMTSVTAAQLATFSKDIAERRYYDSVRGRTLPTAVRPHTANINSDTTLTCLPGESLRYATTLDNLQRKNLLLGQLTAKSIGIVLLPRDHRTCVDDKSNDAVMAMMHFMADTPLIPSEKNWFATLVAETVSKHGGVKIQFVLGSDALASICFDNINTAIIQMQRQLKHGSIEISEHNVKLPEADEAPPYYIVIKPNGDLYTIDGTTIDATIYPKTASQFDMIKGRKRNTDALGYDKATTFYVPHIGYHDRGQETRQQLLATHTPALLEGSAPSLATLPTDNTQKYELMDITDQLLFCHDEEQLKRTIFGHIGEIVVTENTTQQPGLFHMHSGYLGLYAVAKGENTRMLAAGINPFKTDTVTTLVDQLTQLARGNQAIQISIVHGIKGSDITQQCHTMITQAIAQAEQLGINISVTQELIGQGEYHSFMGADGHVYGTHDHHLNDLQETHDTYLRPCRHVHSAMSPAVVVTRYDDGSNVSLNPDNKSMNGRLFVKADACQFSPSVMRKFESLQKTGISELSHRLATSLQPSNDLIKAWSNGLLAHDLQVTLALFQQNPYLFYPTIQQEFSEVSHRPHCMKSHPYIRKDLSDAPNVVALWDQLPRNEKLFATAYAVKPADDDGAHFNPLSDRTSYKWSEHGILRPEHSKQKDALSQLPPVFYGPWFFNGPFNGDRGAQGCNFGFGIIPPDTLLDVCPHLKTSNLQQPGPGHTHD